MESSVILQTLRKIRLTDHESKTYLALLEKDTLTVTEISRIAGIPRANAYEALDKLLAKGLCVSRPGKTKRYRAVDPTSLQDRVLTDLDESFRTELEDLDQKRREIVDRKERIEKDLGELIEELTPHFINSRSKENPLDYIEVIKEPLLVHRKLVELSRNAEREILGFSKPPYSGRKQLDEQVEEQHRLLRKGLTLRAIYEIPEGGKEKRDLIENLDLVTDRGEESRVIRSLPLKMLIFDEATVLLALEDPVMRKTSLTSLVIEHQHLAKALKIVFETLWRQAEDYRVLKE